MAYTTASPLFSDLNLGEGKVEVYKSHKRQGFPSETRLLRHNEVVAWQGKAWEYQNLITHILNLIVINLLSHFILKNKIYKLKIFIH